MHLDAGWSGWDEMKRVAVFGNAGGGKSTLARELASITGLPLHVLDKMQFRPGGKEVPHEEYLELHEKLLGEEEWIIDGYGCLKSAWLRFEAADTLIHVDLPLPGSLFVGDQAPCQGSICPT